MAKLQPIYNNLPLLRAVNPLLERELESKEVKMIFVTYRLSSLPSGWFNKIFSEGHDFLIKYILHSP